MEFYNTTHEKGDALELFKGKAKSQDKRVLQIFKAIGPMATISPSGVFSIYGALYPEAPITSIRRSITNLTKAGLLEKTAEKRIGPLGRPEYAWKIPAPGSSVEASGEKEAQPGQEERKKASATHRGSQGSGKQGKLF